MAKDRNEYTEIKHIKEDIDSLRTNVVALTKHLQAHGETRVQEFGTMARKQVEEAQTMGRKRLNDMERRVKSKPVQSLLIAFCSGMAMNYVLGRRNG